MTSFLDIRETESMGTVIHYIAVVKKKILYIENFENFCSTAEWKIG